MKPTSEHIDLALKIWDKGITKDWKWSADDLAIMYQDGVVIDTCRVRSINAPSLDCYDTSIDIRLCIPIPTADWMSAKLYKLGYLLHQVSDTEWNLLANIELKNIERITGSLTTALMRACLRVKGGR